MSHDTQYSYQFAYVAAANRGRMFRKPLQQRRPDGTRPKNEGEPAIPAVTDSNAWDGSFPDPDGNVQASIEYSENGLRELLKNDTLIVTRSAYLSLTSGSLLY